ncbi:MAG TPA: hypothetical protein VIW73_11005 [Candidatus Cybelea sp.]
MGGVVLTGAALVCATDAGGAIEGGVVRVLGGSNTPRPGILTGAADVCAGGAVCGLGGAALVSASVPPETTRTTALTMSVSTPAAGDCSRTSPAGRLDEAFCRRAAKPYFLRARAAAPNRIPTTLGRTVFTATLGSGAARATTVMRTRRVATVPLETLAELLVRKNKRPVAGATHLALTGNVSSPIRPVSVGGGAVGAAL